MEKEKIIKELQKQDQTVISFPSRNNEWGNARYRGNCSGWIQAFLIWKYQVEKFAELFSGSGTGYDVAKDMGVKYVGADLNPTPVRPGILNVNAITDEVPEEFVDADFMFMHPPYSNLIKIDWAGKAYADPTGKLAQYDLGNMDWNTFMKTLNMVVMKYYSAMQNGAKMGILMGDVRRNGFHSMLTDIVKPGKLEQVIIKMQHNTVSERNSIQYAHKNFVPIVHEYIMVLKKVVPYIIDFSLPMHYEGDIRDSVSATWRDVVVSVMKKLGGKANLESIYKEIDGHKKCQSNEHWREKIRQTLQQYSLFINVERGVWQMAA